MSNNAVFIGKDGQPIELPADIVRTYNALHTAAQRINENVTKALYKKYGDLNRVRMAGKLPLYTPTQSHRDIVDAMPKVLDGRMTPEEAMGLLWEYDAQIAIRGKAI